MTLLLLLACAGTPPAGPWTNVRALEPALKRLDTNADGKVGAEEWARVDFKGPPFAEVDKDGDGDLELEELRALTLASDPVDWYEPGEQKGLTDLLADVPNGAALAETLEPGGKVPRSGESGKPAPPGGGPGGKGPGGPGGGPGGPGGGPGGPGGGPGGPGGGPGAQGGPGGGPGGPGGGPGGGGPGGQAPPGGPGGGPGAQQGGGGPGGGGPGGGPGGPGGGDGQRKAGGKGVLASTPSLNAPEAWSVFRILAEEISFADPTVPLPDATRMSEVGHGGSLDTPEARAILAELEAASAKAGVPFPEALKARAPSDPAAGALPAD